MGGGDQAVVSAPTAYVDDTRRRAARIRQRHRSGAAQLRFVDRCSPGHLSSRWQLTLMFYQGRKKLMVQYSRLLLLFRSRHVESSVLCRFVTAENQHGCLIKLKKEQILGLMSD